MRPNTGPTSLLHLLSRRRVSFERWCEQEGIQNQLQFQEVAARIEQAGEFFIPQEMKDMALSLPDGVPPALAEPETPKPTSKPAKKPKTQPDSES
jgi:hypothetical protein